MTRATLRHAISPVLLALGLTISASAQTTLPTTQPTAPPTAQPSPVSAAFAGRNIEAVRIVGNYQVPTSVILNHVRSREGEPLDPATVEEDYKRIYDLKRFGNVEAKVESTESGVIVSFVVSEQKQIKRISFRGNRHIDTLDLQNAVELTTGESIDPFRIAMARQAVEQLYKDRNYTYVQVRVLDEPLSAEGELVFDIVEGQKVRVRRIAFEGNRSFSNIRLRGQVKTDYYIWIFRAGQLEFDQLEDDVASLRRFYEDKGFFDVKIGRKLAFSADQNDVQVTFFVEEGPRYSIGKVVFNGIKAVDEQQLRAAVKMVEGVPFDKDVVDRDIRQIVRVYSPYGYVYQPQSATPNPDYLAIDYKRVFRREAGTMDLVYEIHEGKPFRMGRVIVNGNSKTQDKVVLREMHVAPGQLYNSAETADAVDRLRGTGYFSTVTITPVGNEPDVRDVLVDVTEGRTATFQIGAGVSSNGGVSGDISYEERNFDIGNYPASWREVFSETAFRGAGQTFRVSISPSTSGNSAGIRFVDPYLFDQPYIFANDIYYRERGRTDWDEKRFGDRVSVGRRLGRRWTVFLNLRGEDVGIDNIDDPAIRAQEILDAEGHTTVTGAGPSIKYDSTNRGPVLYKGLVAQAGYERAGALGGQVNFNKYTASLDQYFTIHEDLFDRRTVLALHSDVGYIDEDDAPVYEKFYAGGMGSIRGYRYRGISPRSGPDDDAVGGVFQVLNSAELSYPIYENVIRGVLFCDTGTVERDIEITDYRVAVGFGFRFILPFAPNAPLSLDFGFPVVEGFGDERQIISFAFGFVY